MRFVDNSEKVLGRIKAAMNEAIAETAEEVGDIAQSFAPVRTGELRDSKFVQIGYMIAWIGFTAGHARHVIFGTSRMAANPFFYIALVQIQPIFISKLRRKRI